MVIKRQLYYTWCLEARASVIPSSNSDQTSLPIMLELLSAWVTVDLLHLSVGGHLWKWEWPHVSPSPSCCLHLSLPARAMCSWLAAGTGVGGLRVCSHGSLQPVKKRHTKNNMFSDSTLADGLVVQGMQNGHAG